MGDSKILIKCFDDRKMRYLSVFQKILQGGSIVFDRMFSLDLKENREKEIFIVDVPFSVLKRILDYLSSGFYQARVISEELLLYSCADKYLVTDLKSLITKKFQSLFFDLDYADRKVSIVMKHCERMSHVLLNKQRGCCVTVSEEVEFHENVFRQLKKNGFKKPFSQDESLRYFGELELEYDARLDEFSVVMRRPRHLFSNDFPCRAMRRILLLEAILAEFRGEYNIL
jgi:hypothetical protein